MKKGVFKSVLRAKKRVFWCLIRKKRAFFEFFEAKIALFQAFFGDFSA